MPYKDPQKAREMARLYKRRARTNPESRAKDAAYAKARRARNPDKVNAEVQGWRSRNRQRNRDNSYWWEAKRRYGITKDQWNELLASQGGVCAVCRNPEGKRFHLDHDHASGRNRGLLCARCNLMLGQARDSAETLRLGAAYLDFHRG